MAARDLYTGQIHVSYSQAYLMTSYEWRGDDLHACFAGQVSGLCGAAEPDGLWLTVGLHTGWVQFAAELHDAPPALDDDWEDVVEVPFLIREGTTPALVGWAGGWRHELDLPPGPYRVRYSAWGMDAGHQADVRFEDEPQLDRYLLQFWPSDPRPAEVIRSTSEMAAYWHEWARNLPSPPTPEERAEATRREQAEEERRLAREQERIDQSRLEAETRGWGGRLPSEPVRRLRGNAAGAARRDVALTEALAAATPAIQHAVMTWVIARTYEEAGLSDLPWIAPALEACKSGKPLPPPFDDPTALWVRLFADPDVPQTTVPCLDRPAEQCLQQSMALPAILAALEADPLQGALDALAHATHTFGHHRYRDLFAEIRDVFPILATPPPCD
jgi:hypothetical protein